MNADSIYNKDLVALHTEVCACQLCPLAKTRTQVVWGSGSEQARIMFVGEAPGRNEDEGGLPFIGAAGAVLDKALGVIGIGRNEIFITNVVKCRPPKNRTPKVDEVEACHDWLERQISLINPSVIVPLGAVAMTWFLGAGKTISQVHGNVFQQNGRTIFPLYHPAATIYDQSKLPAFIQGAETLRTLLQEYM